MEVWLHFLKKTYSLSLDCDVAFFERNILNETSHVPIRKAKGSAGYD